VWRIVHIKVWRKGYACALLRLFRFLLTNRLTCDIKGKA